MSSHGQNTKVVSLALLVFVSFLLYLALFGKIKIIILNRWNRDLKAGSDGETVVFIRDVWRMVYGVYF